MSGIRANSESLVLARQLVVHHAASALNWPAYDLLSMRAHRPLKKVHQTARNRMAGKSLSADRQRPCTLGSTMPNSPLDALVRFVIIYSSAIYGRSSYRSRMEEGQRRAAAAVARRDFAPPRLRNRQADRTALRRRAPFSRGVAIPVAVSPGEARLDSRAVGREERPAPAALLPDHCAGAESPGVPAAGLADVRRGHQPHHRSRKCLTGKNRFASNWRT